MSAAVPPSSGGPGLPEEDAVRVAEFALGLLPEVERASFAGRVAREQSLRGELAFWEEALAPFAEEIAPVAPPAALKQRLEAALFEKDQASRNSWWRRLLPWSVAALASAAAAILLVVALPVLRSPGGPGPVLVSEIAAEGDVLRVLAAYDAARGGFRIERTAGAPAAGRAFELWAIGTEGVPISLGVLPNDGLVPLPEALRGEVHDITLAISDEPEGGSPTGAPTGDVLATGALVSL